MTLSTNTLISIKSEIERLSKVDPSITDVIISIKLKEKKGKDEHFMYINLKEK
jgi:hypothetical protein